MHKVILSKSVIDFLDTKDREFIKAFYEKIKLLENDPFFNKEIDIKKFKGRKKRYRLRIGKYKFMYEVID